MLYPCYYSGSLVLLLLMSGSFSLTLSFSLPLFFPCSRIALRLRPSLFLISSWDSCGSTANHGEKSRMCAGYFDLARFPRMNHTWLVLFSFFRRMTLTGGLWNHSWIFSWHASGETSLLVRLTRRNITLWILSRIDDFIDCERSACVLIIMIIRLLIIIRHKGDVMS